MPENRTQLDTVTITGAFSYTGKYATRLLLESRRKPICIRSGPPLHNAISDCASLMAGMRD